MVVWGLQMFGTPVLTPVDSSSCDGVLFLFQRLLCRPLLLSCRLACLPNGSDTWLVAQHSSVTKTVVFAAGRHHTVQHTEHSMSMLHLRLGSCQWQTL